VSRVQRLACNALAAKLEATNPTLVGRVKVLQQPPDTIADYPVVVLMPERFTFVGLPDDEARDDDGDPIMVDASRALMHVGEFRGSIRIWLASRTPGQREELEESVLSAFYDDGLASGRCVATLTDLVIGGQATGYDTTVAFFLNSEDFREELVFSEKRWVFTQVDVDLPVLALRRDAWVVNQMVVALTEDIETTVDDPTDVTTSKLRDLEQHTVTGDGTLGTYP
jgi:hypothetical protein